MLTWATANADGPSHGWAAGQPDDLWTALCGVEAYSDDLVETNEDKCVLAWLLMFDVAGLVGMLLGYAVVECWSSSSKAAPVHRHAPARWAGVFRKGRHRR